MADHRVKPSGDPLPPVSQLVKSGSGEGEERDREHRRRRSPDIFRGLCGSSGLDVAPELFEASPWRPAVSEERSFRRDFRFGIVTGSLLRRAGLWVRTSIAITWLVFRKSRLLPGP